MEFAPLDPMHQPSTSTAEQGAHQGGLQGLAAPHLPLVAQRFRQWVCAELAAAAQQDREGLRGDYLFVIDGVPRFVVLVDHKWSGSVDLDGDSGTVVFDEWSQGRVSPADVERVVLGAHRVRVTTSSKILQRLLVGSIRARHAYLAGHVAIDGDLPCFLRLVALLKARGVAPLAKPMQP